jgi:hypothetical protein
VIDRLVHAADFNGEANAVLTVHMCRRLFRRYQQLGWLPARN